MSAGQDQAQRRAKILSDNGWRFQQQHGPRGIYYEGIGPRGRRIMSPSKPDEKTAFLAALDHAYRVYFL